MFVVNMFYEVNVKNYFLKINQYILLENSSIPYIIYRNNNKINSESRYKIVKIIVTYN